MGEVVHSNSKVNEGVLNVIGSAGSGAVSALNLKSDSTTTPAITVQAAGPFVNLISGGALKFSIANNGNVAMTGALTGVTSLGNTGDVTVTSGNVILSTVGKGLTVKEGTNARMGTGTLNGATEVTISTTAVTANSRIFLTIQAPAGTPSGTIYVSSRVAATSFGVKSAASDTSTFAWMIVEPSA